MTLKEMLQTLINKILNKNMDKLSENQISTLSSVNTAQDNNEKHVEDDFDDNSPEYIKEVEGKLPFEIFADMYSAALNEQKEKQLERLFELSPGATAHQYAIFFYGSQILSETTTNDNEEEITNFYILQRRFRTLSSFIHCMNATLSAEEKMQFPSLNSITKTVLSSPIKPKTTEFALVSTVEHHINSIETAISEIKINHPFIQTMVENISFDLKSLKDAVASASRTTFSNFAVYDSKSSKNIEDHIYSLYKTKTHIQQLLFKYGQLVQDVDSKEYREFIKEYNLPLPVAISHDKIPNYENPLSILRSLESAIPNSVSELAIEVDKSFKENFDNFVDVELSQVVYLLEKKLKTKETVTPPFLAENVANDEIFKRFLKNDKSVVTTENIIHVIQEIFSSTKDYFSKLTTASVLNVELVINETDHDDDSDKYIVRGKEFEMGHYALRSFANGKLVIHLKAFELLKNVPPCELLARIIVVVSHELGHAADFLFTETLNAERNLPMATNKLVNSNEISKEDLVLLSLLSPACHKFISEKLEEFLNSEDCKKWAEEQNIPKTIKNPEEYVLKTTEKEIMDRVAKDFSFAMYKNLPTEIAARKYSYSALSAYLKHFDELFKDEEVTENIKTIASKAQKLCMLHKSLPEIEYDILDQEISKDLSKAIEPKRLEVLLSDYEHAYGIDFEEYEALTKKSTTIFQNYVKNLSLEDEINLFSSLVATGSYRSLACYYKLKQEQDKKGQLNDAFSFNPATNYDKIVKLSSAILSSYLSAPIVLSRFYHKNRHEIYTDGTEKETDLHPTIIAQDFEATLHETKEKALALCSILYLDSFDYCFDNAQRKSFRGNRRLPYFSFSEERMITEGVISSLKKPSYEIISTILYFCEEISGTYLSAQILSSPELSNAVKLVSSTLDLNSSLFFYDQLSSHDELRRIVAEQIEFKKQEEAKKNKKEEFKKTSDENDNSYEKEDKLKFLPPM